jgi:hypothetical protein
MAGELIHGQEQPVSMPRLDRSQATYTPQAEIATEGQYPDGYENASEGWRAAFDHAARHKNSIKASILYADAHEVD